jgi:hypothetical protein
VQPLPIQAFSATFDSDTTVRLQWTPTVDPAEPTAQATHYALYTALDEDGFDNGVRVDQPFLTLPLRADHRYRFRITAINAGGESFPSETLAVCRKTNARGIVMIINGFDRLSAPGSFHYPDGPAGFSDQMDHGIADRTEYNYIGRQHEFRRSVPWRDDDATGFGASNADYETTVIAGNTFDYPALHGTAIAAAGYSYVSSSAAAVMTGAADLSDYPVVDLILGEQRQTTLGRGVHPSPYKTFPEKLQQSLAAFCAAGGSVFVTGAYLGSDLWDNPLATESDRRFAEQILHYRWRTGHAAVTGRFHAVPTPYEAFSGQYAFHHELNSDFYAVESPDAIEPADESTHTLFRYTENNLSAGIAHAGHYRVCAFGFPFEAVRDPEARNELMQSALRFLHPK